jgi:NTE family protein
MWPQTVSILTLTVALAGSGAAQQPSRPFDSAQGRPKVGVAFGGGSARGLAHVGVIRWFEEHRIPIDRVSGTSMGGLVGGAFASGMNAAELHQLLAETDWNAMFGASSFQYKNVRRKEDARDYPSRIEFGLKRGIVPPPSLNNGQQVEFLLSRIGGAYSDLQSFDELPTPFRCMAVDLKTSTPVVLDKGSLPRAMRATMSLPLIFPPVEADGRVLVDGGAMNNVPADVARAMGSDVVIAVNVGEIGDREAINRTLFGVAGDTLDSMMRASTRRAMASADLVITPVLKGFGSLDWRRSGELEEAGYQAAEAMKAELLKLAVDESTWNAYIAERQARRRTEQLVPQFLSVDGAARADERMMRKRLEPMIGSPLDIPALEKELESFSGLDRYETVGWERAQTGTTPGLLVRARHKPYAPPFFMLGVTLTNATSDEFAVELAARYLAFDLLGSGSELRVDGAAGSVPRAGVELYRPIGASPLFVAGYAGIGKIRVNFIEDDVIIAQYDQTRSFVGLDGGINIGRENEVRVGVRFGRLDASVHAGDPQLPELGGTESVARARWIHDSQDSPVVPSKGARVVGELRHWLQSPDVPPEFSAAGTNDELTQLEAEGAIFWSVRHRRDRVFVLAGGGTSFDGNPLPTAQFQLGEPLRLGAVNVGEIRGPKYLLLTTGYLVGIGRLPDFMGGPIFAGGWLENGSAFERLSDAQLETNGSIGLIADTLIGPVVLGTSIGFDGGWRYYIGVGRVLR